MTYKLDPNVAKIISPILLIYDGCERAFENGKQLADAVFDKNYLIDSINIKNNMIAVTLKENDRINNTNWCGEEQVSFD